MYTKIYYPFYSIPGSFASVIFPVYLKFSEHTNTLFISDLAWVILLFFSDFCLFVFWTTVSTTYIYHPFHTKGFIIWSHKNLKHTHLQSPVRCVTFRISPTRFRTGKGIGQSCVLSPCLFNVYTQYIMRNIVLDEAQAGIKTSGRNINNLRYADYTTLMAENEEEVRASWWKWKRRVKKLA